MVVRKVSSGWSMNGTSLAMPAPLTSASSRQLLRRIRADAHCTAGHHCDTACVASDRLLHVVSDSFWFVTARLSRNAARRCRRP
jgi:hypothetical protein